MYKKESYLKYLYEKLTDYTSIGFEPPEFDISVFEFPENGLIKFVGTSKMTGKFHKKCLFILGKNKKTIRRYLETNKLFPTDLKINNFIRYRDDIKLFVYMEGWLDLNDYNKHHKINNI